MYFSFLYGLYLFISSVNASGKYDLFISQFGFWKLSANYKKTIQIIKHILCMSWFIDWIKHQYLEFKRRKSIKSMSNNSKF